MSIGSDALANQKGPPTTEEYVRETLRDAILSGKLAVGSRLVQSEIARSLQVSVTPVREALRALASERLIDLDPYRGAVVRGLSVQDVRDIHLLRELIEPEVMRRAVENITPEELEKAEEIQHQLRAEADPGRWADLNRSFHRVFLDAARSELLAQVLTNLHDNYAAYIVSRMMVSPEGMKTAVEEHDKILDGVRAGDADEATRWVLHHMKLAVDHAERVTRRDEA